MSTQQQSSTLFKLYQSLNLSSGEVDYFQKGKEISASNYEKIIAWNLEIMDTLHLQNQTKALSKIYIDNLCDFKLISLIAIEIGTMTCEKNKYQSQSLQQIKRIRASFFSDDKIAEMKNSFLLALNFKTKFITPYFYMSLIPFASLEFQPNFQIDLVNTLILSSLCYQLVNFKARDIFFACVKFLFKTNISITKIIPCSILQQQQVHKAYTILTQFAQESDEDFHQ